ncbi:hypothetical protein BCR44DRAFT_1429165 [Catenaria anguillulae PL171]|uniref:Uncharacterized protein n=1 Tax=Catenaria anguillulae PL171 TaxID=765915 RepID=A0A1Y2HUV9_9FUNG|nr:hypothetical protein BCR44DRAFT_1429165 [Catenaria anguillulae PL171]
MDVLISFTPFAMDAISLSCTPLPRHLLVEIAEQILVLAIRANTNAQDPLMNPAPMATYLNVLPDSPARDITRAAIMQMWWIDCNLASVHGHVFLLDLLVAMAQHRPLQYSLRALYGAIENCHLDVVKWWYQQVEASHYATNPHFYIGPWLAIPGSDLERHVDRAIQSGDPKAVSIFEWFITSILEWDTSDLPLTSEQAQQVCHLFPFVIKHEYWPILSKFFGDDRSLAIQRAALCFTRAATTRYSRDSFFIDVFESGNLGFVHQVLLALEQNKIDVSLEQCTRAALKSGHLHLIEWFVAEKGVTLDWDLIVQNFMMDGHGKHLQVLDWFLDRFGLAREHVGLLLELAARHGSVAWLERAYEVDPGCASFNMPAASSLLQAATDCAQVQVLEWWQEKGLPVCNAESTLYDLDAACLHENATDVLDWWACKSGLTSCYRYSDKAFFNASLNGCVAVLEWWKIKFGMPITLANRGPNFLLQVSKVNHQAKFDPELSEAHSRAKAVSWAAMVRWWVQSGLLELGDLELLHDVAALAGDVLLLDHLLKHRVWQDNEHLWTLPLLCSATVYDAVHVVHYLTQGRPASGGDGQLNDSAVVAKLVDTALCFEARNVIHWIHEELVGPFHISANQMELVNRAIKDSKAMVEMDFSEWRFGHVSAMMDWTNANLFIHSEQPEAAV